jgi:hypothetical protein
MTSIGANRRSGLRIHALVTAKTVQLAHANQTQKSHLRNELRSRTLAGITAFLLARNQFSKLQRVSAQLHTGEFGEHLGMAGAFRLTCAPSGARRKHGGRRAR